MTNKETPEEPTELAVDLDSGEADSGEADDEIILARRREGFGVVSIDVGTLIERAPGWTVPQAMFDTGYVAPGDEIPMRRGEAEGRIDFEVAGPLEEGK